MVKSLTNPFDGRPTPLGTLLSAAGRRLGSELDQAFSAAGFDDLRSAHTPLFTVIDPDGSSVTELARKTQMTKQAMGETVRYLEQHGYVEVTVHPDDRRTRRVRLTQRGWDAVAAGERVVADFDSWLASSIGAGMVDELRQTLDRIINTEAAEWGD